jgi:hypothetical protein
VQYRDGRRCVILAPQEGGRRPCTSRAAKPPAPAARRPLRAAVLARLTPGGSLHRVHVRFRAPAAVADARQVYLTSLALPATRACGAAVNASPVGNVVDDIDGRGTTVFVATTRDLAVGAVVRASLRVPRACHGTARGRVQLKRLEGSQTGVGFAWFAPGRTVARFTVRLP